MKRPLIIAECAVEHLGSLEVAKQMAYVSEKIGVDIVKYQLHLPSEEMLPNKINYGKKYICIIRNNSKCFVL